MSERLIDANALMAEFNRLKEGANLRDALYLEGVMAVIFNAPTIYPKRGEWTGNWISTDEDLDGYFDGYKCLNCMEVSETRTRYCSNCGADMRKE